MMEAGNYDKPKPGNVSSLQEIEEYSKKMELSSLELQVQSYKQSLLKFGCQNAEIRENGYWINSRLGVMEGLSNFLTQEPDDSYSKIDSIRANFMKRVLNCDNVEEWVSAGTECCSINSTRSLEFSEHMNCSSLCERDLVNFGGEVLEGSSGTKIGSDSQKGKVGFPSNEVEQLYVRLQNLEEDNQIMKKAFFASVEERSELVNEISQQFQIIHQHLRNRTIGETSLLGLLMSSNKDESMATGLSEVLQQDSNPSLVTRVLKAKSILAFQEDQDPTATGAT